MATTEADLTLAGTSKVLRKKAVSFSWALALVQIHCGRGAAVFSSSFGAAGDWASRQAPITPEKQRSPVSGDGDVECL